MPTRLFLWLPNRLFFFFSSSGGPLLKKTKTRFWISETRSRTWYLKWKLISWSSPNLLAAVVIWNEVSTSKASFPCAIITCLTLCYYALRKTSLFPWAKTFLKSFDEAKFGQEVREKLWLMLVICWKELKNHIVAFTLLLAQMSFALFPSKRAPKLSSRGKVLVDFSFL